ncbi:unnamed protein product [Porites evermanni]|uniref:Uncharacterized protein n=1 Tax=Porites evermanni TaxID=104178 RepID=A0ABN8R0L0_9CNID|nr:unnamed protein product [Porites evermanni]
MDTAVIVAGSITGLLLLIALAFGIFICCLRRKLPDGVPKPPVCTTVKVGCGLITAKLCPCCQKCQYSSIPGD